VARGGAWVPVNRQKWSLKLFQREQRSLFGEILDWMLTPLLLLWPISLALTWLVASMARVPLADASCQLLASVFSPLDWQEAKRLLEESLKLDEKALNGSAYTSLATLYAKVPGWPVGFGDKERAEEYFKKALAINPDGIDPNFFYGEYLADRGRTGAALTYLEKALKAPPRPGREVADSGRRQEIQALLAKVRKESK